MKHAVAISTYITDVVHTKRLLRCVQSLKNTGYPSNIIIVSDGSDFDGQSEFWCREIFDDCLFNFKMINTGISRCKNTCIRVLCSSDFRGAIWNYPIDVGFLVDDDMEFFEDDWWEHWLCAIDCTGIGHWSWADVKKGGRKLTEKNGYRFEQTEHLNGSFLTFTPEIIQEVGGFPVSHVKWGWDHVNWTNRIVRAGLAPGYCDIINSNNYIRLQENAESAVSKEQRRENRKYEFEEGSIYQEVIE